jgi:hypothetical protein
MLNPADQEILLIFTDKIPEAFKKEPVLISGTSSRSEPNREYILAKQKDTIAEVFEIRFQAFCSPFNQVILFHSLLAAGHHEYLYLFSLRTNENIVRMEMQGYFGHFYLNNDKLFVTDAGGMYCFGKSGGLVWKNLNLGIDGVIINEFIDGKILGSGEWDPPGGWEDFILDEETGRIITL